VYGIFGESWGRLGKRPAADSKSDSARSAGSTPARGTNIRYSRLAKLITDRAGAGPHIGSHTATRAAPIVPASFARALRACPGGLAGIEFRLAASSLTRNSSQVSCVRWPSLLLAIAARVTRRLRARRRADGTTPIGFLIRASGSGGHKDSDSLALSAGAIKAMLSEICRSIAIRQSDSVKRQ
jgi:hypothetical protein